MLARLLSQYWWVLLLRGGVAVLFGAVAYAWPGLTLGTLILLFAAYALVDGVLDVVKAFGARKEDEGEFWMGLSGAASIVFGFLMLAQPGAGAMALLWLIAIWPIVVGVSLIIRSFRVRSFWPKQAAAA